MKKVHVLVEGQTEKEFVGDILQAYFSREVYLNPIVAKTKQAIGSSPAFRGGIVSYGKFEFDLKRLLHDSSAVLVTTMIDYYRLPSDFPGFSDKEAQVASAYATVKHLEKRMAETINHRRFLPYISIHEFEALLFCDTDKIVEEVRGVDEEIKQNLKKVREAYNNPEEINKKRPPSKRILEHLKEYEKIVHGYLVAIEIGIDKMRQECPHFQEWLTKIDAAVK